MSRGRWVCGLAGVAVWLAGCIEAEPPGRASAPARLDAEDAGEPFDAGPVRPPTGHVPDGSFCGQLSLQGGGSPSDVAGGGPGRSLDDPGRAAADGGISLVGTGMGGAGQGLRDAGPPVASPAHAGAVVITELLADPKTLGDTEGEWIELYNPGTEPLELATCRVGGAPGAGNAIASSLVLGAGHYATLARSPTPGFAPSAVLSFSLTNTADTLVLSCGGVLIDQVSYDRSLGFPLAAGASAAVDPSASDATSNDEPSAWCLASDSYGPERGTPGAANPPCLVADAAVP